MSLSGAGSRIVSYFHKPEKTAYAFWSILLVGYIVFNKGFAYMGIFPLYVSEIGLFLGFLCTLAVIMQRRAHWERLRQITIGVLGVFLLWQFVRTLPYLTAYRLDTLRDAMLWGYSAYTFLILLTFNDEMLKTFIKLYSYLIPFMVFWFFPALFLLRFYGISIPFLGSPNLLWVKSGDAGVHLAGIAAFLLLYLDERFGREHPPILRWAIWILWWLAWIIFGSVNRGSMISALMGFTVLFFIRKPRWFVPLLIGVVLTISLYYVRFTVPYPNPPKVLAFSSNAIALNLRSATLLAQEVVLGRQAAESSNLFSGLDRLRKFLPKPITIRLGGAAAKTNTAATTNIANLMGDKTEIRLGTFRWRVNWWTTILDYTFQGEHFWGGKGYGINLAQDDGFQVKKNNKLRSPHNASMTILARSGVPGLVFWLAFLLALGLSMMKMIVSRTNPAFLREKMLWMMAYFLAFLVNSSVDVFLEGPMGGIWFWSLIGIILATIADEKQTVIDFHQTRIAPAK